MTGCDNGSDWTLDDFNADRPSPARVYDYWLGGTHNFAADREVAEKAISLWPELPQVMRANRAFLQRVVRFLVSAGVRQFLDLGSGVPANGNVHEIAQSGDTGAKVVYVDLDPVAVAHSRAMLHGNESATIVQADLREPSRVLESSWLGAVLDLNEPVAVLMMAVLHFVADDENPAEIVAGYRDALAPGSYLALSHGCSDGLDERACAHEDLYRRAGMPMTLRTGAAITEFFDGLQLVEPGVTQLPSWLPDNGDAVTDISPFPGVGGVGHKS